MLVVFETDSGNIAADLSEVKLKLDDKNQIILFSYKDKDYGKLNRFTAINEDEVYTYFEQHQDQIEFIEGGLN